MISHALAVTALADYFISHPYSDLRVQHFYLKVIAWNYVVVIVTHLWIFTNVMKSGEQFYVILVTGHLFETLCLQISKYREEIFMTTSVKPGSLPPNLDFYLEELIRLSSTSYLDFDSKVQLIRFFKMHIITCENTECPCRTIEQ